MVYCEWEDTYTQNRVYFFLCYTYFIASKIPHGDKFRLLSLIPKSSSSSFSSLIWAHLHLTHQSPSQISSQFLTSPSILSKMINTHLNKTTKNTQKKKSSPIWKTPPKLPLNFSTKSLAFCSNSGYQWLQATCAPKECAKPILLHGLFNSWTLF